MPNKPRSTISDLVAALAKIAILADLWQMPPAAPAFVAGRAPDGDMLAVIRRLLYPRCRRDEQLREIDTAQHVAGNGRQRDADLGLKAGAERLVAAERLDGKRGDLAKIAQAGPFLAKRFVRQVTDLRPFQKVHRGLIIGEAGLPDLLGREAEDGRRPADERDRKSTRLNSSH